MDSDEQPSDEPGLAKIFKKNMQEETNPLLKISSVVKQCELDGSICSYQTKMIENVLNFQNLTASDIMTHRIDIIAVNYYNTKISNVLNLISKHGFSRIPVYKHNIDTIIGAIFVKDLIKLATKPNFAEKPIKPFIRNLLYVPKSINCVTLFLELTKTHNHLAVVVDDFGGTFGIVTIENIIETIFGQIQDEYDNEDEDIIKINDSNFIIQGFANLKDVCDILDLTIEPNLICQTMSGFIINLLGHIPEPNEPVTVSYDNFEFTITEMEKHHIKKIKAIKKLN